jgi:hypothetical protein
MTCVECKKWVSDDTAMARMGYAKCEYSPAGHYRHGLAKHETECTKKLNSLPEIIATRMQFFEKLNKAKI